jgi:hypothetical protein
MVRYNRAVLHANTADPAQTAAAYRDALTAARRDGNVHFEISICGNLSSLFGNTGDLRRSRRWAVHAVRAARDVGDLSADVTWSAVFARTAPLDRARRQLDRALMIARRLGHRQAEVIVIHSAADRELSAGMHEQARAHAVSAVATCRLVGDRRTELMLHRVGATAAALAGDRAGVASSWQAFLDALPRDRPAIDAESLAIVALAASVGLEVPSPDQRVPLAPLEGLTRWIDACVATGADWRARALAGRTHLLSACAVRDTLASGETGLLHKGVHPVLVNGQLRLRVQSEAPAAMSPRDVRIWRAHTQGIPVPRPDAHPGEVGGRGVYTPAR